MKKKYIIGIVIIIIVILLIAIFENNDKHITSYVIKDKKNSYYIREYYEKDNYYFIVRDNDKNRYSFSLNSNVKDKNTVIKKIKKYINGELKCLYPIYVDNIKSDLHCIKNNKNYNVNYLKQENDEDYLKILELVNKDKLNTLGNYKNGTASSYKNLKVYKKNLLDDYYFTMWNYNGINVFNNKKIKAVKLLDYDQYDNKLGILLNNYYVYIDTMNRSKNIEFKYYNLLKDDIDSYIDNNKKHNISINVYFNGVDGDLLYFTDKKGKLQYTFDINKKVVKKITDGVDSYVVIRNGEKDYLNKSVFLEKEQYFNNSVSNKKISKLYDCSDIREVGNYYYAYSSNGDFYRIHKLDITNGELLFNFDEISTYKINNLDVLLVVEDTLFMYNEKVGLIPIVINEELKYNYENICDFWKK